MNDSEAQTTGVGKISGRITDQKTGETIIGATVSISGSAKASATGVDGTYLISGITPGTYTLVVKYIGYQTKSIADVEIKNGQATQLDVVMSEAASQQLQEVVITTSFRKETVNSLYAQQKNNFRITDGISRESISKSPDKNTGEVLKRVSGTSIQDNKFVVVRGLGDRYNSTLMNNSVLPSSEPDKKSFSFDVIPSNLIDNIVINKTASPDLPGDFSGGAVQITTRDFPIEPFLSLQIGGGYNTQTTFKDFKRGSTGNYDFLGFDDGSRKLPSAYKSVKNSYLTLSTQEQLAISQQFPNTFGVRRNSQSYPIYNFQGAIGNSKQYNDNSKFGYIFSANYRNGQEVLFRQRNDYNIAGEPLFGFNDVLYNNNVNLGGLLNLAYSYKKNKFALKNFYSNSFSNNYVSRAGAFNESGDITNINSALTDVTQNGLLNSVFEGQHNLDWKKVTIDYNLSYGYSYRKQPDQRILESQNRTPGDPYIIVLSNYNSPSIQNAGRVYSDLKENIYGANLSFSVPYKLFNETNKFKIGGLKNYRDRSFSIDALGYSSSSFGPVVINIENGYTFENIFNPSELSRRGVILSLIPNNSFNYQGTADLNSGLLNVCEPDNLKLVFSFKE